MKRACLYCGGQGCLKTYENNAGDYHWERCVWCDGYGRENPERLQAIRDAQAERDRERTAYVAHIRATKPWWIRWWYL